MRVTWQLVVAFLLTTVSGNRIGESIYQDLDATYSCFKITNATHEFGCTADFSGNVGVLHVLNTTEDLQQLVTLQERQSLVVVLPRTLFTVPILEQLEVMTADTEKGDVRGVLLALPDDSWEPASVQFSEDDVCPNRDSGFYRPADHPEQYSYCNQKPWNPDGTGMFRRRWSFPIILLKNETEISDVYECHARYNAGQSGWPRCSAELNTFMTSAGNSEICWRRTQNQYINTKPATYCAPMGSINVFGTLSPPAEDGPVVMLAARADGGTMFDALAPAADSAVVGMVALLAVAKTLAQLPPVEKPKMNVMYMLFSGESFDYIGSDRFVYDMSKDKFPPLSVPAEDEEAGSVTRPPHLHLQDLQLYLELSQLAQGKELFLHSDPVSRAADAAVDQKVRDLIQSISSYSAPGRYNLSVAESAADTPLPPASLHSLLRANQSVPGVVLADHAAAYTNRHYHSVYDVAAAVGAVPPADELVDRLTRVTQVVASALYTAVSGQPAPEVTVDEDWLRGVVECYFVRADCSLFRSVMDELLMDKYRRDRWQQDRPIPTYVSVAGQETRHTYLMYLTQNLLTVSTGAEMANITTEDACKDKKNKVHVYRWLLRELENGTVEGYCTRSLVAYAPVKSPAFEIEDYDWTSGRHPSWAESQWDVFQLRLFLQPSLGHDLLHLLLGLAATLLAVLLVLVLEKRSHLVFTSPR